MLRISISFAATLVALGGLAACGHDKQELQVDAQTKQAAVESARALAVMLLRLLPPDGSSSVVRMLRGLATPGRRRPRRDATWLAHQLMSMVPDARLPGPRCTGASALACRSDRHLLT